MNPEAIESMRFQIATFLWIAVACLLVIPVYATMFRSLKHIPHGMLRWLLVLCFASVMFGLLAQMGVTDIAVSGLHEANQAWASYCAGGQVGSLFLGMMCLAWQTLYVLCMNEATS